MTPAEFVDEFADVLRQVTAFDGEFYPWDKATGYRAVFSFEDRQYWYSVNGTKSVITPLEVASAITSPRRKIRSGAGPFRSNKGEGFQSSVKSGDHWYMLKRGPA